MASFAKNHDMLFVASVGPGYNDTGIRPWNKHNTKARDRGQYYTHMFNDAIAAAPDYISITSYNEWGEGTQIEPAVPHVTTHTFGVPANPSAPGAPPGEADAAAIASSSVAGGTERAYADYGGVSVEDTELYLRLTSNFVSNFAATHARNTEQERARREL